jgi:hypothetical protein
MKLQRQNAMKRGGATWLPGAMTLAAAGGASQAATVQITFNNSFVSSSSGNTFLVMDVGGDGMNDVYGYPGYGSQVRFAELLIGPSNIRFARALAIRTSESWYAHVSVGRLEFGADPTGDVDSIDIVFRDKLSFSTDVAGAGVRDGWLDIESSFKNGEPKVQILRFVFDDAGGAAPAFNVNDAPYLEYSAISAVPEPGGVMGVGLVLGAAGLIRRRQGKAA